MSVKVKTSVPRLVIQICIQVADLIWLQLCFSHESKLIKVWINEMNGVSTYNKLSKTLKLYRVFHIEMFLLKWLWHIELCNLDFVWRCLYIPEVIEFEFHQPVFKKKQPPTEKVPYISENLDFWWSIPQKRTNIGYFDAIYDQTIKIRKFL